MIEDVLKERGSRYGAFKNHAAISQGLQQVLVNCPNWGDIPADARQAMIVICDKMARACNGDPEYDDNWIDIIGYSQLVLDNIKRRAEEAQIESNFVTAQEPNNKYFSNYLFDDGPNYNLADDN